MDNIKMFMTCTGLEVIAEVESSTDQSFVAKRPLVITPVPQGNDTYGLAFLPYSPADSEGSVRFFSNNIVSETIDVPDALKKAYIQRTSDLEIVSSLEGIK